MNDNYLWDRTGKPDTDIQELEELLGTLRYRPRPLEIPATIKVRSNRRLFPIAIAAAIALLIIGAGLWVRFANSSARTTIQAAGGSQSVPVPNQTAPPENSIAISTPPNEGIQRWNRTRKTVLARNVRRPIHVATPALSPQELAEKEQVLVALRLLSAKLNLIQRKSQGIPQVNAIRNQHKMG